jgi:peptidyl-prolyl cis-trans isomerase C
MTRTVGSPVPSINGVFLTHSDEHVDTGILHERAYAELLRQEAIRLGKISNCVEEVAPTLSSDEQNSIQEMLDEIIHIPTPTREECQRYYDSNRQALMVGQSRKIRHILFAVTPSVNVNALAQRAEAALFELKRLETPSERFAELAAELSNCPSGMHGGELGWLTPQDCAPELSKELFYNQVSSETLGIFTRLVSTRHGFHIIDVLALELGRLPEFELLKEPILLKLQAQSKGTALRQFMSLLVRRSKLVGVHLDGAHSNLVQ